MAPRVRVVIQSRLSSSRLPGKALLSVAGVPMVALAALRAANQQHEVVVATSDAAEDDLVAGAALVPVVRGPLEDVLSRFVLATADLAPSDVVVRLTADNVLPDGSLVSWLVSSLGERSYVRIGGDDPAVPYGVAAEAFTVAALRSADAEAEGSEREHVTPRIRALHGDHRLAVPDLEPEWAGLRCTVDTFDDLLRIGRLFADEVEPVSVPWRTLCARLARLSPAPVRLAPRRPNPLNQGPLVLGTVQLGLAYGAANATGQPSPGESDRLLSAAAAAGVTHLDTARAYGDSEERIGAALARGLGEHLGVVTKVAPLSSSVPAIEAQASIDASLRRLRVSRVSALLTHRAKDWFKTGVREAMSEELAVLRGASLSAPEDLVYLLADPLCTYVQLPFNLLDRRWLSAPVQAALAARPDVVVTVRSAYLQGLLVAGTSAAWPALPGVSPAAIVETLDALVKELGRTSRADLCLAYVLAHPWVTSVVVGAETAAQIEETAGLVRQTPLNEDEVALVHARLPAGPPDLVDPSRWGQ